ncbi:hypothetical protein RM549_05585 [Salegentibacter sp. F188]|uniref:Uncharacterized protein n=1 Tax=Autumnicola patrickiae TaxID=3075591 RepID=A0ABU3E1V4_9FLAO|nr:hypothetical protein [Salegentibacter sp. F188]MDT0689247.1 hypothetical protein [Salegentibacter sp. F188]
MTDKELYKIAVEFLSSFSEVTDEILSEHLKSEYSKPKDLSRIYYRICESAQNKQMSSKVIGGSIGGLRNLDKILYGFDPVKVAETYSKSEKDKLLDRIIEILNPRGQIRRTSRSIWPLYCQSVIDAAHFLSSFKDVDDFYKWTDFFAEDFRAKPALPLMISYEISGMGFPLACDFLKELGFSEYGKPDVHLKDIFKALNLIEQNEKSATKLDYQTFKVIDRIAKENHTTVYSVDKVFWLIGSGNFYLSDLKIGGQKKAFIEKIKDTI